MTYLLEVPVEGGGRLLVQAVGDAPAELELAASPAGTVIAKAKESLEDALDQITPAIRVLRDRITAIAPNDVTVEFGLVLSAETGLVVAKGGGELHFKVTASWSRDHDGH